MYFLFSGEGPTDLGRCADGAEQCTGDAYEYGPMTVIVSQIVENKHDDSPISNMHFGFVSKKAIAARKSELKMKMPRSNVERETAYFYKNARLLARFAKEKSAELNEDVVAVLFRDSDDPAGAKRGLWSSKQTSMLHGFEDEGFLNGVPMIPKPKSEAWIICALKNGGGDALEKRSGNDKSPNSLKGELQHHLGHHPDRERLRQMVKDGDIDFRKIQMPSFHAFRQRLEEVI